MVDPLGVQVGHAPGYIGGKREAEPPIEGDGVVLKDVVQTPLGAVLADDAEIVRVLHSGSHKLAQVRVIQGPAYRQQRQ